MIQNIHPHTLL